jgi:hypothetical protein
MDLDFDEGTAAADAALALAEVERRVRERFPMILRLLIQSCSPAQPLERAPRQLETSLRQ